MSRDTKFDYSKSALNKAGKNVRLNQETIDDIKVIENWRASHNHILNSWQSNLRNRITNKNTFFAQRLKRRITIFDKLKRQPTMALANMHDIAGCRLIFPNLKELNKYRKNLHTKYRFKHKLFKKEEDQYNYIQSPAYSGYRGIHDVYIYRASHRGGEEWNDLKVEIQYRTVYQHAWATAVEIAGSITGNHSKFDKGSEDQKEFFRLCSEIIARAYENSKSCYLTISNNELIERFNLIENKIHLLDNLEALTTVSIKFSTKGQILILKSIFIDNEDTEVKIYSFNSLPEATKKYFDLERTAKDNEDIVLVKASDQESIRNAYKNYFSDTNDFVKFIRDGKNKLEKLP